MKRGVNLLVKSDIATIELADQIIDTTKQLGPYYVVMPKVALAHTRVGDYNKKIGISLVVYKRSVSFSEKESHQVNLVFTLSATDNNSHMELLSKFAEVMSKPNIIDLILESKNTKEIYEQVKEFL
ncbi:MAG: PTS sugar transporter subunit IIA [Clostridia bacterium]